MVPTFPIEPNQLRALLILRMTADPFPEGFDPNVIDPLLNEISQSYGHEDWIAAYHAL